MKTENEKNLTNFTMISYQYSKCNFKEDDWQIISEIKNEKELYIALKEGYLADASNRNNYPMSSFTIRRKFFKDSDIVCEPGFNSLGYEEEEGEEKIMDYRDCERDVNFEYKIRKEYSKIFKKFERWEKKIKTLIPVLRQAKRTKIQKENEIKRLFELAEKYKFELIEKEEYLLAEFQISSYHSTDNTSEKMIITDEEAELIKASNISLDVEDGLDKSDIYISKINKPIKDYLETEEELSDNFWMKRFINLSNENTSEYKINKKKKELEDNYKKRSKLHTELLTLNKLDKKYISGIDIKGLNRESDIVEISINRLKREIGELKDV